MREITVIKNGILFNSERKAFSKSNLYIKDGEVIAEEDIKKTDRLIEWNAEGNYVSPGFIDMHVHVFENYAKIGINADKVGINQGVTTVVDAGSTGYKDFYRFRKMAKSQDTEIFSFLNISNFGLVDELDELSNPDNLISENDWNRLNAMESSIVGLKARMSQSVVGKQGIRPLEHARKLADQTVSPIMVHIGSPPPPLSDILPLLKQGDIVTHAFHGKKGGILDENGVLIPEAQAAIERGVKLDVGHGTSSFSYRTIKRFQEKYSYPFTISTDIYDQNFEKPVGSLMDTISKLLAVGYRLEDLLESVTILPAKILSLSNYGTLKPGNKADITIFNINKNKSALIDSRGESITINQRLIPQMTWKKGKLVYKRG